MQLIGNKKYPKGAINVKTPYKKNDWITHKVFGDGQIQSIKDEIGEIIFDTVCRKKFKLDHPSIS